MVQAPIFHVNGDDPEAVVHCARIAAEYRQLFHKDVVIDMFCYRRFGHNETDEPAFTQPLMYSAIKQHPSTLELYAAKLVAEGTMSEDDVRAMIGDFNKRLDEEFDASKSHRPNRADWLDGRWTGFSMAPDGDRRGDTAVDETVLKAIGKALTTIPEDFNAHKTIARLLNAKAHMFESGEHLDWATAEALAFGTLLKEGVPVRLSGQDSVRGTFSQRHAALVDQKTEERYLPLSHLSEDQAEFEAIDSLLSEEAVVGFEYGYSLAEPKALVLWEAQFGDFANGAQVMIDQFIASGEMKWLRMSGLVLLLPHGYEGQGPEHSSARLERYLQLCAQDNIQVANCTTPANYFHILRRQVHRPFRKPLILMTPKSLLRHKRAVSKLSEMGPGSSFHRVLWTMPSLNRTIGQAEKGQGHQACPLVLRQSLLRSLRRARKTRNHKHPDSAHRTALSVPGKSAGDRTETFCQCRNCLVPGRAEKSGRLDLYQSADRADHDQSGPHRAPALYWPARICIHRGGIDEPAYRRVGRLLERRTHTLE